MDELRHLLEKGTIFSRIAQLSIDNFVKYFFPWKDRQGGEDKRGVSESSQSNDEQSIGTTTGPTFSGMKNSSSNFRRSGSFNNNLMQRTGSGSLFSSPSSLVQSNKVADKVQRLEAKLKAKISVDFNSVRKAFLAIDDNHVGYINAESLARYLGASKQKYFDFTLLEIMIKMHTSKSHQTRINYNDFCAWLGSAIEPTETFYFRHDSKKNPQFEISFRKNVEKNLPSHRNASEVLTRNHLK